MPTVKPHKMLTIEGVSALGRALIKTADLYPTRYLTERDFFPLVVMYLDGRVPTLEAEASSGRGKIDFHSKGNNPTWLELAVQPRTLIDKNFPTTAFPGHAQKTSLYASQNKPEVRKLMLEPTGKTRFLLLVDFHGGYDTTKLKTEYQAFGKTVKKGKAIRVVFSSKDRDSDCHFKVGA